MELRSERFDLQDLRKVLTLGSRISSALLGADAQFLLLSSEEVNASLSLLRWPLSLPCYASRAPRIMSFSYDASP